MARPFSSAGANYVGVRDLATSVSWYKEKLGLREIDVEMDDIRGMCCARLLQRRIYRRTRANRQANRRTQTYSLHEEH